MKDRLHNNSAFVSLLLISLFLHAVLLGLLVLSLDSNELPASASRQMNVTLSTSRLLEVSEKEVDEIEPLEPPEPPESKDLVKEEELIDHKIKEYSTRDEFSSSNQDPNKEAKFDYGAKQEVVKKQDSSKAASAERTLVESSNNNALAAVLGVEDSTSAEDEGGVKEESGDGFDLKQADSSGMAEQGAESELPFIPPEDLKIPLEFLGNLGNMELLPEEDLDNAYVEDPFSEVESKELKLVNRYLKRLTEQVYQYWVNPYQGGNLYSGIIKLELDVKGYLVHAYIAKSSGYRLLDISALDAIRAVPRYEVPENEIITRRYYTNLSFHYSSIEEETELMPFEQDKEALN